MTPTLCFAQRLHYASSSNSLHYSQVYIVLKQHSIEGRLLLPTTWKHNWYQTQETVFYE